MIPKQSMLESPSGSPAYAGNTYDHKHFAPVTAA
jgi:hypothetical protein